MNSKDLFPGLPDEFLDDFQTKDISQQEKSKIKIVIEKRKYGKLWAVLSGIKLEKQKLKELLKAIKRTMSCGGTIKKENIEILFGKSEKLNDLISILEKEGFDREMIFVSREK